MTQTEDDLTDTMSEQQECIDRAYTFYKDVLSQVHNLAIQDYGNLNRLGCLLEKYRTQK